MLKKQILSAKEAAALIKDGSSIMVGGFMSCGDPTSVLNELAIANTKNLTLICNDTGVINPKAEVTTAVAQLVVNKQFKKIIASHIGTNKETGRQINEGETEVQLVPQGTLAEQIRSAGVGLGGVITPTGLGTEVEEGKQTIEINGKTFLVEEPLSADFALIKAKRADKHGNAIYSKSTRNFNPLMAMAGKTVILEVDEIVEVGELDPENVVTPAIFVNYLVLSNS